MARRGRSIHDGGRREFRTDPVPPSPDDIYAIRSGLDSVAVPLLATEFNEFFLAISPNGRWLACVSDLSGRDEVYVRPFPDPTDSGL